MKRYHAALLTLTLGVLAASSLGNVTNATAAAAKGPYTAAQANAGQKAYLANCARCHGVNLQGVSAPALTGTSSGLHGDSLSDAYTFISTQMPAGAPGSLSSTDYVNIVSYIMKRDAIPAGTTALTAASAQKNKTVKI